MLRNLLKINIYHEYLERSIILILFWLSINTGSKYLTINYLDQNDLGIIINLIRSLLPYFIILYFLINFNFFLKSVFEKIDLIYKLFFVYGFCQLIGLIYNYENLFEHYWIICLFALLLFFISAQKTSNEKLFNNIFFINIIIIGIIFSIFIFIIFKKNIFYDNLVYNSVAFNEYYNYEKMPRSSGLSRMSLIIFIFMNSIYFSKMPSIKIKKFLFYLNIILISIILILQSRGVILSFILILILINFLYNFNDLKQRFNYNFLLIAIPILIFSSYPLAKENLRKLIDNSVKIQSLTKNNYKSFKLNNKLDLKIRKDFLIIDNHEKGLIDKLVPLSNNRILAWKFLIQIFFKQELNEKIKIAVSNQDYDISKFKKIKKKNIFTGYGPQADRHLMFNISSNKASKDIQGPFGSHSSNGYIYSLICSGIFGLLVFCIINLLIIIKIIKIFLKKEKIYFNLNPFLSASIICILFLQFRILFENSFSVYGIDMILLLSSYLIVQNEYKKLSIEK